MQAAEGKKSTAPLDAMWPLSAGELSSADVRRLSNVEFAELLRRLKKRARAHGQYGSAYKKIERTLKIVRKNRPNRRNARPIMLATQKPKHSSLLDALAPGRMDNWIPGAKRRQEKEIEVSEFSFLDNPIRTLETLASIADAEASCYRAEVNFEDQHVLDIGPYLVWGMMRHKMAPFMTGGRIKSSVTKVLRAVNLHNYMNIQLADSQSEDVWSFPIKFRRPVGTTANSDLVKSPPTFSKISDELVDTVDRWLQKINSNFALSTKDMSSLNRMTTEILENAERHSDSNKDGDWVVAGFMARREARAKKSAKEENEQYIYVCHIAFVSLGLTIGETIADSEAQEVQRTVEKYRHLHGSGALKKGIPNEVLDTIVAMQDGISRFRQDGPHSRGGVGMMEAINFAADLGKTDNPDHQHAVCIISGRALIKFSGAYPGGKEIEGRRIQWFNKENSLEFSPDENYVTSLNRRFPGTVITMRFVLDPQRLSVRRRNGHRD